MTAVPPPVGPNLNQWAQSTRTWLQRWLPKLQWKTAGSNPSENGTLLWDEDILYPVVSKNDAFIRLALLSDVVESIVVVKEASQLSGTLLSSVAYMVDGHIDMGSTQITIPEGGLTILGVDFNISSLSSSENSYTMFISPGGGYSGDFDLRNIQVTVSGTGSQLLDIDNDENGNAFECTDVNFVNCTSLGEMVAYRQGLWSRVGIIQCDDGLTMSGAWSGGFAILDSILVSAGVTFNGTILKEGTSLTVDGSIRSNMNALQLGASGEISDIQPSNITNDAEFRMEGVRSNPSATPFPNMPASNVKARFSRCVGFRNTYVGGYWKLTTESTTSIASANTPVKVAGTTTYEDLNWFSNTTDNALVFDGADQIGVVIHCDLAFTGGANDQINVILRHWVDSTSSFTDLAESGPQTMNQGGGGNRAENIAIHAFCDLDENDRLEVWVENQSDSSNVTCKLGGLVSITERPS